MSRRLPQDIQPTARRKLRMLNNAEGYRPPIGWKHSVVTVRVSTASGSMIDGECASYGGEGMRITLRSWIITETIMKAILPNVHPGEVLLEEFLRPRGISQNALARAIGVPPRRINEIVLHKRAVTADTALRLARAFGTSERFWMGLQTDYDLEEARRALAARLDREVHAIAA